MRWLIFAVILIILGVIYYYRNFNNFTLIAKNVTELYRIIEYKYEDRFDNPASMLALAGAINGHTYIECGQISLNDIFKIAYEAEDTHNPLLEFIVSYEVMLFSADTTKPIQNIIAACNSQRPKIYAGINKANAYSEKVEKAVDYVMNSYNNYEVFGIK